MNIPSFRLAGAAVIVVGCLTASAGATTPAGRYTTTSMTVYDTVTKLIWQRAVPAGRYTWSDAKTYCGSAAVSAILGGTGRLPTAKELPTIVDYSLSTATVIDSTAFPATPVESFWSSSQLSGAPTLAWIINFELGNADTSMMSTPNGVRCVR